MTTATAPTNLFRAGWKAEQFWGDEITAHHMNTRSVYTFKADDNVRITHSAVYADQVPADCTFENLDRFAVTHTHSHQYHESGALFTSVTSTVATFDNWLDAYYCAIDLINNR
jgi:hypothetical protein